MGSFEEKKDKGKRVDISPWELFWKVSFIPGYDVNNLAKFLKDFPLFADLSKYEISILSKYLHHRVFNEQEVIFENNSSGIGFYIVYQGQVEIDKEENKSDDIATLGVDQFFGEIALFQKKHIRRTTARAGKNCELLCIFRPDLENFIDTHPAVAAKFILIISRAIATKLQVLIENSKI